MFLVGFMGAGKTSVGRVLARRLGWKFIDLDDLVEKAAGCSIAEMFRDRGEAGFREAETAALRKLTAGQSDQMIVAVGGGAFCRTENVALIRKAGARVVFLDAPVEELRRRCASHGEQRPLYRDQNQFRQLYESRRQDYMKADIRVENGAMTIEETAAEVVRRLGFIAAPGSEGTE